MLPTVHSRCRFSRAPLISSVGLMWSGSRKQNRPLVGKSGRCCVIGFSFWFGCLYQTERGDTGSMSSGFCFCFVFEGFARLKAQLAREGFFEAEDIDEVLDRIFIGFVHQAGFDHVEHDGSKIT